MYSRPGNAYVFTQELSSHEEKDALCRVKAAERAYDLIKYRNSIILKSRGHSKQTEEKESYWTLLANSLRRGGSRMRINEPLVESQLFSCGCQSIPAASGSNTHYLNALCHVKAG